MPRAKVHKPRTRFKNNSEPVEFSDSKPLAQMNVSTGVGYCRIKELWEAQGCQKLPRKEAC